MTDETIVQFSARYGIEDGAVACVAFTRSEWTGADARRTERGRERGGK